MKGPPVSEGPLFRLVVPDLPPPSRDQTSKVYIVDSSLRIKGLLSNWVSFTFRL